MLLELQRPGLHRAYLDRQITLLAPTDRAMAEFRGRRGNNLGTLNMSAHAMEKLRTILYYLNVD